MSKMVVMIGIALMLSFPAFAEDQTLDGTYSLVSITRNILETGQVIDGFGRKPSGYINYDRNGRVLVVIVSDRDDRPSPNNVGSITDEQRAGLFRTMVAYGGTYKFDGHSVEHYIDISWNEAWTGTTQIRDVQKDGDKLIYTTRAAPFSGDGKISVSTLIWQKLK